MLNWLDERLGTAGWARAGLRKVFPDHWSFLLGEIALFCLVVLVLTGVYLTLFYVPDATPVVYDGPYEPLRGHEMSAAFRSVLQLSFEVQAGLVMRQVHHWAALVFVAAIVVHMARVFFTGAFRRPRELNWLVGISLLLLALAMGLTGYSLPDDLLSGTGIRLPAVRRRVPRRVDHQPPLRLPHHAAAGGPARRRRGAPLHPVAPEAHAVRRAGAHEHQRRRKAVLAVAGLQVVRALHADERGAGADGRHLPDQPDLDFRPVRSDAGQRALAAGLVHGLARRCAAHFPAHRAHTPGRDDPEP